MHRPSELCISRQTNEARTLTSSLCLTLIKSSGLIPTRNWQLDTTSGGGASQKGLIEGLGEESATRRSG